MDIEILDTLKAVSKLRPDLCQRDGDIFTLRFPDGSKPLEIDATDEGREGGESDFAIMVGWALQVLQNGLAPYSALLEVRTEDDDGMDIYNVIASLRGIGRIGESEIFEYAVFDCLRQCLKKDAFSFRAPPTAEPGAESEVR
jgi:hypothetical protein